MKFAISIVVLFLAACGVESLTDDLKTAQAYKIYMTGEWYDESSCCGKVALWLEPTTFKNMSGMVCSIHKIKMTDENIISVKGDNCTSDGIPIDNVTLFLKPNKNDLIDFRYSDTKHLGIPVWLTLKRDCQKEKKEGKKNDNSIYL